jgi:hypothetical protein
MTGGMNQYFRKFKVTNLLWFFFKIK